MDSLHILQEREDLGKTFSRRILPILEEADKSFPAPLTNYYCDPGDSNADLRRFYLLLLRVAATAHLLTPARIDSQISMISRQSLDSTSRVFIAGKLVDITHSAEIVPTVEQLQRLLGNDIPEIRILAVDWFGLSSTPDIKDKVHFMKIALNTNPTQVKESAFRGLLKWRPSELYALRAAGDPVADACAAERANINIQSYCAMLIAK